MLTCRWSNMHINYPYCALFDLNYYSLLSDAKTVNDTDTTIGAATNSTFNDNI